MQASTELRVTAPPWVPPNSPPALEESVSPPVSPPMTPPVSPPQTLPKALSKLNHKAKPFVSRETPEIGATDLKLWQLWHHDNPQPIFTNDSSEYYRLLNSWKQLELIKKRAHYLYRNRTMVPPHKATIQYLYTIVRECIGPPPIRINFNSSLEHETMYDDWQKLLIHKTECAMEISHRKKLHDQMMDTMAETAKYISVVKEVPEHETMSVIINSSQETYTSDEEEFPSEGGGPPTLYSI